MHPIYIEISYQTPEDLFTLFAKDNGSVFLDSAQIRENCGRYSFIGVDPFLVLQSKNSSVNPFEELREHLQEYKLTLHPNMPPFQGGVIGFFSYDLYQHLEKKITQSQIDLMEFPDMMLGFYDLVIAFDRVKQRAWIFSSGFPEKDLIKREEQARKRCLWLTGAIKKIKPPLKKGGGARSLCAGGIFPSFTHPQYIDAVKKVKNYILAGDIFQANIAQCFQAELTNDAYELYQLLRTNNPAPFAAYLKFDDVVIASASPERFLKLHQRNVETRPIKGTRPRGKSPDEDKKYADELLGSTKDQSENIMIVDLLRNDLSRVCEHHTVHVPQLCQLESYATVHHLVSVVTGKLKKECDAIDLLCAAFPGGSITGAPKIRAMEIIAEIEPTQRGPYCGSVGYIGFNGDMDTSIVIRTYAIKDNILTFQAGGAIVLDSDPQDEYEEMLAKTAVLKNIITSSNDLLATNCFVKSNF